MLKLFKMGFALLSLSLFSAAGQKAYAQLVTYPATVYLTHAEFNALDQNGSISIIRNSPNVFTGDGNMTMGPGPGPYQDPDPCPDEHTPEIFQQMQYMANATCKDVKFCLRSSDCAYYMYIVKPTAPNCIYVGIGPYQPAVAARRM